jgi:hypothetical protein
VCRKAFGLDRAATSGIEPVLMYADTSRATFGLMNGKAATLACDRRFPGCAATVFHGREPIWAGSMDL